jgi:formate dehydrogenase subunit gamma
VSAPAKRFDETARGEFARFGTTRVRRGELLRHPVYTRFLHWSVAIFFILSLLTGFAIYSPWLFYWITPIFGGGARTRALHPWFGLLFTIFFFFQFLNWVTPMAWTAADRRWIKRLRSYATNDDRVEPEEVGFFNGGQKLYFWAIVLSAVLFLVTGLLLWFDDIVNRWIVAISYVIHDLAGLLMLAGFIIHIYEGTAHQPGTFRSMIGGTVTEKWAWTHHPAWFRAVTGRHPRESYEREKQRQIERERAMQAWEREQDAREGL